MPVLDTNFLIALHCGDEAAIGLLRTLQDDAVFVPDAVAAEFITDWPRAADRANTLAALESDFTVCYADRAWVETAATLRAELRRHKGLVRKPDIWIAAWARHHNTAVVTRDQDDFEKLGVDVVTW